MKVLAAMVGIVWGLGAGVASAATCESLGGFALKAGKIYSPAVNPVTKQEIFPALQPGSELGWGGLAGPRAVAEAVEFFQYVVFNDPAWDFRTLRFDTAADQADAAAGDLLNVIERGQTPERIPATHSTNGTVDRTRPLCPYPQVAKYKGNGSIDDAANFSCISTND